MQIDNFLCAMALWILILVLSSVFSFQTFHILEEEEPMELGRIKTENDDLANKFQMSSNIYSKNFTINYTTGILSTITKIDRERLPCRRLVICSLLLEIAVRNPVSPVISWVTVKVTVIDVNDQAPAFSGNNLTIRFPESNKIGSMESLKLARDLDGPGNNSNIIYTLKPKDEKFSLKLVQDTVLKFEELFLELRMSLDREIEDRYVYEVLAIDQGVPQLTGTMTVTVSVDDINDNAPVFEQNLYNVTVPENTPPNTTLVTILASDRDLSENGRVSYFILTDQRRNTFEIGKESGKLTLSGPLDYEVQIKYQLIIIARDHGQPHKTSRTLIIINVVDLNDNSPDIQFSYLSSKRVAKIIEHGNIGDFVARVTVNDKDAGKNGQVICNVSNNKFKMVVVRSGLYLIQVNATFDREISSSVSVIVKCKDKGKPPKTTFKTLTVDIEDINDNAPKFLNSVYYPNIPENNPPNKFITTLYASDLDIGENGKVQYQLAPESSDIFHIDSNSGKLIAKKSLDRETTPLWKFNVYAIDRGEPPRSSHCAIILTVLDRNDNSPRFYNIKNNYRVLENRQSGSIIGEVYANDSDLNRGGEIQFYINKTAYSGLFRISKNKGVITTTRSLDRETKDFYSLEIIAKDRGDPVLSSHVVINITVDDVNDNYPVFNSLTPHNNTFTAFIYPDTNKSVYITQISAIDKDSGRNGEIAYRQIGSNCTKCFYIGPSSGRIFLLKSALSMVVPDEVHRVDIEASDRGLTPKTNFIEVFIQVVLLENDVVSREKDTKNRPNKDNLSIVIGVISATLLISALIIMIIILIIRKHKNHRRLGREAGNVHGRQSDFQILKTSHRNSEDNKLNFATIENFVNADSRYEDQNNGEYFINKNGSTFNNASSPVLFFNGDQEVIRKSGSFRSEQPDTVKQNRSHPLTCSNLTQFLNETENSTNYSADRSNQTRSFRCNSSEPYTSQHPGQMTFNVKPHHKSVRWRADSPGYHPHRPVIKFHPHNSVHIIDDSRSDLSTEDDSGKGESEEGYTSAHVAKYV